MAKNKINKQQLNKFLRTRRNNQITREALLIYLQKTFDIKRENAYYHLNKLVQLRVLNETTYMTIDVDKIELEEYSYENAN